MPDYGHEPEQVFLPLWTEFGPEMPYEFDIKPKVLAVLMTTTILVSLRPSDEHTHNMASSELLWKKLSILLMVYILHYVFEREYSLRILAWRRRYVQTYGVVDQDERGGHLCQDRAKWATGRD